MQRKALQAYCAADLPKPSGRAYKDRIIGRVNIMKADFDGTKCVYCGVRTAETVDHVFARKFFLESRRSDLPQVPACSRCNGIKANLEGYLMTVLPFGGRHADALANLNHLVPPRLRGNRKLHAQLARNASKIWSKTGSGFHVQSMALPIELAKIVDLFTYIVRGLLFHHWNVMLGEDDSCEVILPASAGQAMLGRFMLMNAKAHAHRDLGCGTFIYQGIQGLDDDRISIWRFSVYGDITLTDDTAGGAEEPMQVGALTGPKRVFDTAALRERLTAPMNVAIW